MKNRAERIIIEQFLMKKALKAIQQLDRLVERELQIEQSKSNNKAEHSYQ